MKLREEHKSSIIGSTEIVEVAGIKNIPAKIDTGADTSAIWASDIDMDEDGVLTFTLFSQESPLYTGEKLKTTDYKAKKIRSSYGDKQIRYRVKLPLKLGNKRFETTFTLANRSRNHFPVLIGRHTIEGKYLVDVSVFSAPRKKSEKSIKLSKELEENPYRFHLKYINKNKE